MVTPNSRLKLLSVDFVTARPVDECRARLVASAGRTGQRVRLLDDGSFALKTDGEVSGSVQVRFWGTMEAVERGTWVWGTVMETGARRAGRLALVLWGLAALCLFGIARAALEGEWGMFMRWGVGLALVGIVASVLWWWRHRAAMRVVTWVYETLYLPPHHAQAADRMSGAV